MSNYSYATAFIVAVTATISSPPINISQIGDISVLANPASNSSVVVSYKISVTSQFPVAAYSSQLVNAVNTGLFTIYLQVSAKIFHATGFYNATSSAVTIGKQARRCLLSTGNNLMYINMTRTGTTGSLRGSHNEAFHDFAVSYPVVLLVRPSHHCCNFSPNFNRSDFCSAVCYTHLHSVRTILRAIVFLSYVFVTSKRSLLRITG